MTYELIKRFEGCRLRAYEDGGGTWTIGWGHTHLVVRDDTCTQPQADAWLEEDATEAWYVVKRLVEVPITAGMKDALTSFVFNLGAKRFADSTLLRRLNLGEYLYVPEELCKWKMVKRTPSLGLSRRRVAEAARFLEDGLP